MTMIETLKTVQLAGYGVILQPLSREHEQALQHAVADGQLWQLHYANLPQPEQMLDYIETALHTPDRVAFVVIDATTQTIIGSTSYYHIDETIQRLEIGYTWYAQSYWRTHINTACKYLLLHYAFDTLNCAVVGWRTDALNERSQRAIERLGAKKDGVLRHFQQRKDGSVRDTVMYSMLKDEWYHEHQQRLHRTLCP